MSEEGIIGAIVKAMILNNMTRAGVEAEVEAEIEAEVEVQEQEKVLMMVVKGVEVIREIMGVSDFAVPAEIGGQMEEEIIVFGVLATAAPVAVVAVVAAAMATDSESMYIHVNVKCMLLLLCCTCVHCAIAMTFINHFKFIYMT
jgi:hypothetical protein